MSESIYKEHIKKIKSGSGKTLGYQVIKDREYYSNRYDKRVRITTNDLPYDGATFAPDIDSFSWLFHDVLKREKTFFDGSVCSNTKASFIIHDILKAESRYFTAKFVFLATLIYGTIKK